MTHEWEDSRAGTPDWRWEMVPVFSLGVGVGFFAPVLSPLGGFAGSLLCVAEGLDLASVLKRKIQPAFKSVGIIGVGWHTFCHTVGTMLAEMGKHRLTILDYLRHSNLHVTNKYLQALRAKQGKMAAS